MYISFKIYNSDTQKQNFSFNSKTSAVKVVKNKKFRRNIQERNNSIIEMLKQGMTREAVAEKMGLTCDYIKLISNKLGFNCQEGAKTDYMLKIEKRNQQIKDLLMQGVAVSEIAKITGFSISMIRNFMHKLEQSNESLLPKSKTQILNKSSNTNIYHFKSKHERNMYILDLLKSGMPREEVAEKMGLSLETLRVIARKNGFNCKEGAITTKMAKINERNKRIFDMKEQGLSISEIAKREGISTMTVLRIINRKNKTL